MFGGGTSARVSGQERFRDGTRTHSAAVRDALSLYPCRQCGGDCEGIPAKGVRAVTWSQRCEPVWTLEERAA